MRTGSPERGEGRGRRKSPREYAVIIGVTLATALFLKFFVIEAYRIPTGSMEETLFAGDYLLVNKFQYGARTPRTIPFTGIMIPSVSFPPLSQPRRGDVVVFESPVRRTDISLPQVNYVKRCIALPGDEVKIRDRVVFVNDNAFPDPLLMKKQKLVPYPQDYVDPRMYPRGFPYNADNYGPVVCPRAGQELDLTEDGVNRWRELIEREGHSVEERGDEILVDGAPVKKYTLEEDYYFMMGDNRRNSLDSRFWGFVPESNLIGKAMAIYWSWNDPVSGSLSDRLTAIRWSRIGTIVQ